MRRCWFVLLTGVLLQGALVALLSSAGRPVPKGEAAIAIVAGATDREIAVSPLVAVSAVAKADRPSDPVLAWVGGWQGVDGASMQITADPAGSAGHYRVTLPVGLAAEMATLPALAKDGALLVHRPYGDYVFRRGGGESSADARLASKSDCLTTGLGEAYCR